jgi:dTDP-4-amino-4,6-dideoxygalactose transaminase
MTMRVPFLDIAAQNTALDAELESALEPVLRQGRFILGPAVEAFEHDFAEYLGVNHCVGLNSGTSALHMALIACNVGPGDEVITTPHTWISTSWAISYVGATPVYVDIDPKTYAIDPELVEKAITSRTKAIMPVHLYGQAADIKRLRQLADKHGLRLIEDAAQAHGAAVDGRRVGSFGEIGCFSFYPGKNLGAFGEGGAIVTNDMDIAQRIRRLRDHAQDGRHHHVEIGFNTRMEGIQGAVLQVKLKHLDAWNHRRRRHAERYHEELSGVAGIRLPRFPESQEAHVWHLFVVLVDGLERDSLQRRLAERGIACGVHYPVPVPLQPAYAHLGYRRGDFPVAEEVMSRCLSLPMFPELAPEQIDATVLAIRESMS